MTEPEPSFDRDHLCFVCGAANAGGLRLRPKAAEGRAVLRWTPEATYQGYAGVLHGGIVSTLLDEALAQAAISVAGSAPTAEIQVRFLRPVRTEVPLVVEARVLEVRRRVIEAEAELVQEGEVRARARGRLVIRPEGRSSS